VAPEAHREGPRRNMGLEEPQLTLVNTGVTIGDLGFAFAKGLDLGAGKYDATLEGLENVEVVAGATVGGDHPITTRGVRLEFRAPLLHLFRASHAHSVVKGA
jgi:hypothetical protein